MVPIGIKYYKAHATCWIVGHANINSKQQWEERSAAGFEDLQAPARLSLFERALRATRATKRRRRVFSFRADRYHLHLVNPLSSSRVEIESLTKGRIKH